MLQGAFRAAGLQDQDIVRQEAAYPGFILAGEGGMKGERRRFGRPGHGLCRHAALSIAVAGAVSVTVGAFPVVSMAVLAMSIIMSATAAGFGRLVRVPAIAVIVVMAIAGHGRQAFHAQPVLEDEAAAPPGRHGQKRRTGEPGEGE